MYYYVLLCITVYVLCIADAPAHDNCTQAFIMKQTSLGCQITATNAETKMFLFKPCIMAKSSVTPNLNQPLGVFTEIAETKMCLLHIHLE